MAGLPLSGVGGRPPVRDPALAEPESRWLRFAEASVPAIGGTPSSARTADSFAMGGRRAPPRCAARRARGPRSPRPRTRKAAPLAEPPGGGRPWALENLRRRHKPWGPESGGGRGGARARAPQIRRGVWKSGSSTQADPCFVRGMEIVLDCGEDPK